MEQQARDLLGFALAVAGDEVLVPALVAARDAGGGVAGTTAIAAGVARIRTRAVGLCRRASRARPEDVSLGVSWFVERFPAVALDIAGNLRLDEDLFRAHIADTADADAADRARAQARYLLGMIDVPGARDVRDRKEARLLKKVADGRVDDPRILDDVGGAFFAAL